MAEDEHIAAVVTGGVIMRVEGADAQKSELAGTRKIGNPGKGIADTTRGCR
jgi:hypothetical protein